MVSAKSNVRRCVRFRKSASFISVLAILLCCAAMAQDSSKRWREQGTREPVTAVLKPNCHPVYQQLRNVGLSGQSAVAQNVVLKRDAATFTFKSGNFYFLSPVNGKVTGAVFIGAGTFSMVPPLESEKRNLSLLTKEKDINEEFEQLVLRFTDATYEEIEKMNGTSTGSAIGVSELKEINEALKKQLQYNLTGRLLNDVLSNQPGDLFFAFIEGKKYSRKEIFAMDPNGALGFEPEEVVFQTWDENKYGAWAAFHYSDEYKTGKATGTQKNGVIDIQHHKLDTQIEKSGKLKGDATTTFVAGIHDLQVVPFNLFNTLRVQSVIGPGGELLDFIQEDKDEDPQFFVILPKPIAAGEKYTVQTIYSGKDAVSNEGAGNYFPLSRNNWYPNSRHGDYATYEMTFRVPKNLKMVATGAKIREVDEEDWTVTEWKSRTEQSVAGFNFGKFKSETKRLEGMEFEVESYANTGLPDALRGLQSSMTISTTGMIQKALAEAELSIRLFSDYFGPTPFKKISMTQQAAFDFGQAWPELVYLPMSSFLDDTTRFQLLGFDVKGYFKIVGTARSGTPMVGTHCWLVFLPRPVDERRFR